MIILLFFLLLFGSERIICYICNGKGYCQYIQQYLDLSCLAYPIVGSALLGTTRRMIFVFVNVTNSMT